MNDAELKAMDSEMIARNAEANLQLAGGENPDSTAMAFAKSRELGVPFQWAKELDNSKLWAPRKVDGFHPELQRMLALDVDRVPLYRDSLPELDNAIRKIEAAGMSVEDRYRAVQRLYDEKGVPYPKRVALSQAGFQANPGGGFSKDGVPAGNPIAPQDVIDGPEEQALITRALEKMQKAKGFNVQDLDQFFLLSEGGRRKLLSSFVSRVEKENAAIRQLNYDYPEGWIKLADAEIQERLARIGEQRGVDLSDIAIDRLRKGGLGEADYAEAINVLGLRDIYKLVTKKSPEELAAINAESSTEDLLSKLKYLEEESLGLRGRTIAGQVATGVSAMVSYMVELTATAGLAAPATGSRMGLGAAVKGALKAGGFTGVKAASKALFTKGGLKALGDAVGMIALGEAKRLPAFAPKIAAQALNEWGRGPVTYLGEGGLETVIPEQRVDELVTLLTRNTIQTYLGNVSEWGGEFLPNDDLLKLVPKKYRTALVKQFISDISGDATKSRVFKSAISDNVPLEGVLGEIAEEWVNNAFERVSTLVGQATGVEALNMERESVFGDAEENAVIALTSVIGSTGGKMARVPAAMERYRKLTRFVDTHRGMVDAMSHVVEKIPGGADEADVFMQKARKGDAKMFIDPDDAALFLETNPEFAQKVKITEDAIAEAKAKGRLITVSQNAVILEQAKGGANAQVGEELVSLTQDAGITAQEALTADNADEAIEAFREERERVQKYQVKIQSAVETAARSAGISASAQKAFSTVASFMVNYLSSHSTDEALVDQALDRLVFKFQENPEGFSPATALQEVFHGTPHTWAPEPGFPYGRPRLDKIGTGEGVQAFGHGIYFAEAKGVADSYKPLDTRVRDLVRDLHAAGIDESSKEPYAYLDPDELWHITRSLVTDGTPRERILSDYEKRYQHEPMDEYKDLMSLVSGVLDFLEARIAGGIQEEARSLYRLDIPDEDIPRMLLWDKHLSEQTGLLPVLEEALKMVTDKDPIPILSTATGENLYRALANHFDDGEKASAYLQSLGISGLKYLDGFSRAGSDKPTYNYVIWDQDVLDRIALLERNGKKLARMSALAQNVPPEVAEMDVEYMDAVASYDVDRQMELVEKAAKRAGYTLGPVYHWGYFDKRQGVPNTPMHLGTEDAARERAYGKAQEEEADLVEAYEGDDGLWYWDDGRGMTSEDMGEEGYETEEEAVEAGREYVFDNLNLDDFDPEESGNFTEAYIRLDNMYRSPDVVGKNGEWDRVVEKAKKAGYDGIVYRNQFEDAGSDSFIAFYPNQIKLADPIVKDEMGNIIPLSRRFDFTNADVRYQEAVSASDRRYAEALEKGDEAVMAEIVEKAARMAGYDTLPLYHGTGEEFTVFALEKAGQRDAGDWGKGFYFTPERTWADAYAGQSPEARVMSVYLRLRKPFVINRPEGAPWHYKITAAETGIYTILDSVGFDYTTVTRQGKPVPLFGTSKGGEGWSGNTKETMPLFNFIRNIGEEAFREALIKAGYDGVLNTETQERVAFYSNQIKSADPIVRDDQGQVIPPSRRFDLTNADVRYQEAAGNGQRNKYIYNFGGIHDGSENSVQTSQKTGQADATRGRGEASRENSHAEGSDGADGNDGRRAAGGRDAGDGAHGSRDRGPFADVLLASREYHNSLPQNKPADDLRLRLINEDRLPAFCEQFNGVRAANKFGCCVSPKTPEELKGANVLQSADGKSGIAVTPDGDIVAVHSVGGRNALFDLMLSAIVAGGDKLDCYSYEGQGLAVLYQRYGFIPVCRVPFDERYKPDDWNDEVFPPDKRPDVIFWLYNGDPVEVTARKLTDCTYEKYSSEDFRNLKTFEGDNAYAEAWAYRDAELARRKAEAQARTRYQREAAIKGSITFGSDFRQSFDAVVTLFKDGADASTLPHESAHWLKRMMEAMVASEAADDTLKEDYQTIERWLDRQVYEAEPGTQSYQIEREEKFARGFEEYFRTGKAPTAEVSSAFGTLKRYLVAIYRYVTSLRVQLDDEIISVFDRILSTESLLERESPLKEAADALRDTYKELLGLSQDEAKEFIDLIRKANDQMAENLDSKKARMLGKLKTKWAAEARQAMEGMRVYRAWQALKKDGGLDYAFIATNPSYGKEIADVFHGNGLTGKKRSPGRDVPTFAEEQGYSSVDEMLGELFSAQTPQEFTKAYQAQREKAWNEEMELDEDTLSVQASIDTLDKVAELLAVKGGKEGYRVRRQALKNQVAAEIDAMQVKEITSDTTLVNDCKSASKKLVKAINDKDYVTALEVASGLRYNLELMRGKADARKRVSQTKALFRKVSAAKKGALFGDYHNALRELALYFGFSQKQLRWDDNFRRLVAAEEADELFGEARTWSDFLYAENVTAFKNLSYSQFSELGDFADYLYGWGRDLVLARRGTFAERVARRIEACCSVMDELPKKYHDRGHETYSLLRGARRFMNLGTNLNTFLGRVDSFRHKGGEGRRGPNMELRDKLVIAFGDMIRLENEAKMPAKLAIEALAESAKTMNMSGLPAFTEAGLLHGYSKWTPEMVIAACLNMGTASNRQRLRDGYGWEDADLDAIASKLTASDWAAVQQVWDALSGELQRAVEATFLEENHYRLRLIPPQEFDVRTADGSTITVRGGYYPIKYVHRSKGKDLVLGFQTKGLYDDVSSLHARHENIKEPDPVRLSLQIPLAHIHEAAQYAATRMVCREVLGVVRSEDYRNAFGQTQSFEAYEMMLDLLKNIANPDKATEGILDGFEAWARTTLTATALMGNVRSVVMQLSSATVGMDELGGFYGEALAEFAASPVDTLAMVRAKSSMMRHRADYFDIDLKSAVDSLVDGPGQKVRKGFAKGGYFMMRWMDTLVASVGWRAKYDQAWSSLLQQGEDPSTIEHRAVAMADDFIARTQGAARTLDLSPIQLDHLGRLLSPFITSTNAHYNTMLETLGAVKNGRLSAGEALLALSGNFVAPTLFSAVIGWIIAGGVAGDDDDAIDEANKAFIRELLAAPFSGIPLVRDFADLTATLTADKLKGDSVSLYGKNLLDVGALGAVEDIFKALYAGGDAASEGDWSRAAWQWSDALGSALHVPAIRIYTRAKKLYLANGGELPDVLEDLDDAVKAKGK